VTLGQTGFDHDDVTVDQVSPLGADAALGIGTFRISGKNQNGAPIEFVGRWTAVYVREGGGLKIRMISAFPKAPRRKTSHPGPLPCENKLTTEKASAAQR
jgi:ketosteroid isomerase-like protein